MARTDSEAEIQLRKRARGRLIGAVALVTVSVVILPMVLDSEPKRVVHEIDIQIPSENSVAEFTPKIVPEVAPPVVAELSNREPVEDPRPETPKIEPVESKPISKFESRVEKKPSSASTFVVQLGAFSDPLKAKQQQQNLTTNGITTYTENITTEGGEVTRVRIGPFSVRSEAEEMRNRLNGLGINGVVTTP
ncbi:MAG: Cell division protein DedD [Nitrosomonadaceae bacterium]|nr:SPOR domain-containing protein [Nitrosospira sp.]MBI0413398.1 SPOR domain-containing protein [Nitrosospira sp.]MCG3771517.1 Cell division protein DedD [Nitrosomonadaceae bacterium]